MNFRKEHPLNSRYSDMIRRCYYSKELSYPVYGGRGIRVCMGWRMRKYGFRKFVSDIGLPPTPKHTLDRKDNEGHYSCGNCVECIDKNWPMNIRWATAVQQAHNTRLLRKTNKSGYRGVSKLDKGWVANIRANGKRIYLGYFNNPVDAAKAYDKAGLELLGSEFAQLNFPLLSKVSRTN